MSLASLVIVLIIAYVGSACSFRSCVSLFSLVANTKLPSLIVQCVKNNTKHNESMYILQHDDNALILLKASIMVLICELVVYQRTIAN